MLPALLLFQGDWATYVEQVYDSFLQTLINVQLSFEGTRVSCPREPMSKGKHKSFWHCVTEGEVEDDRLPDLRRCERIPWIAWMLRNASNDPDVVYWRNERPNERGPKKQTRVVIAHRVERYVVVLADKGDYMILITAYYVEREHRMQKLLAEYEKTLPQKGRDRP